MDKTTHQVRLEQWTRLITECNNSILTKTDWCRQNNVPIKSFYYWQRKIRSRMIESGGVPAFVELHEPSVATVADSITESAGIARSIAPPAVLQKNGFTFILANTADRSFLTELLEALK